MERRVLDGDIHALVSPGLERRGFLAAFTERTGGASQSPFDSLNLGLETGDDPVLIHRNHDKIAAALAIDPVTTVRQVHGRSVAHVQDAGSSKGLADGSSGPIELGEADALITSSSGVGLAVMVADCVPLALASEREGLLAAVHLGWRGIASGLTQRATAAFSEPGSVSAAIGPCVGPCHYEVGEEVVRAVDNGSDGLASLDRRGGRLRLDLGATVEALLGHLGVDSVDRASECTACEPARFFSHRRDGRTGRQALVAFRL